MSVNNSIPVSTMGCSSVLRRPCNAPTLDTPILNSMVPSSSDGMFYIFICLFKFYIYAFMYFSKILNLHLTREIACDT